MLDRYNKHMFCVRVLTITVIIYEQVDEQSLTLLVHRAHSVLCLHMDVDKALHYSRLTVVMYGSDCSCTRRLFISALHMFFFLYYKQNRFHS